MSLNRRPTEELPEDVEPPSAANDAASVGTNLGDRYQLLEVIGQGGMGRISVRCDPECVQAIDVRGKWDAISDPASK